MHHIEPEDMANDFCMFYRSNRFFCSMEGHTLRTAFYVCIGSEVVISTVQRFRTLCNVHSSCIVRSQDACITLLHEKKSTFGVL